MKMEGRVFIFKSALNNQENYIVHKLLEIRKISIGSEL